MKDIFKELVKETRKLRKLNATIDKQKGVVNALSDRLLGEMLKGDADLYPLNKADRAKAYVTLKKDQIMPQVKDWQKFYTYIKKNNAWDLLQKRPGVEAYRARLLDGKKVAGVTTFKKNSLTVTIKT